MTKRLFVEAIGLLSWGQISGPGVDLNFLVFGKGRNLCSWRVLMPKKVYNSRQTRCL